MISIRPEMPEITTSIVEQSFSSAKFAERNQEDLDGVNTNSIQVQLCICRVRSCLSSSRGNVKSDRGLEMLVIIEMVEIEMVLVVVTGDW